LEPPKEASEAGNRCTGTARSLPGESTAKIKVYQDLLIEHAARIGRLEQGQALLLKKVYKRSAKAGKAGVHLGDVVAMKRQRGGRVAVRAGKVIDPKEEDGGKAAGVGRAATMRRLSLQGGAERGKMASRGATEAQALELAKRVSGGGGVAGQGRSRSALGTTTSWKDLHQQQQEEAEAEEARVEAMKKEEAQRVVDEVCSVCLEEFGGESVVTLECRHRFHKKCLHDWLIHLAKEREAFCPYCKTTIHCIAPNPVLARGVRKVGKPR